MDYLTDRALRLKTLWRRDRLLRALIVLICVNAIYLLMASRLRMWSGNQPGAGMFPVAVGAVGLVALIVPALQRLSGSARVSDQPEASKTSDSTPTVEDETEPDAPRPAVVIAVIAAMIGYALSARYLGHLASAAIMTLVILRALSARSWLRIATATVVFTLSSFLLFERLLAVPLP